MTTKVFEEANLENFVPTVPSIPPDDGAEVWVTPVITGADFHPSVVGSRDSPGTNTGARICRFNQTDGIIQGTWAYSVTADLKGADIADIPVDALIKVIRISFDWSLSYSLHSEVTGDTNVIRLGSSVLGATNIVINMSSGGLLSSDIAELTPQTLFSTCDHSSDTLADSDSGHIETTFDFNPDGISRQDWLDLLDPINIYLNGNLGSSAEACTIGTSPKDVSIDFSMEMTNWRMEVDWEPGGGGETIEITGGPDLFTAGGIYHEVIGGPTVSAQLDGLSSVNQIEDGPNLGADLSAVVWVNEYVGGPNVTFRFQPVEVASVDVSGLYTFVPGKRNDTLYTGLAPFNTIDVAIPDPFVKTALLGG